jgi:predicted nucleic acid-binding protein
MHDRVVIVNTTPIIALSSIQKLELLRDLYGRIAIPRAVFDEVEAKQDSAALRSLVLSANWITTKTGERWSGNVWTYFPIPPFS